MSSEAQSILSFLAGTIITLVVAYVTWRHPVEVWLKRRRSTQIAEARRLAAEYRYARWMRVNPGRLTLPALAAMWLAFLLAVVAAAVNWQDPFGLAGTPFGWITRTACLIAAVYFLGRDARFAFLAAYRRFARGFTVRNLRTALKKAGETPHQIDERLKKLNHGDPFAAIPGIALRLRSAEVPRRR